MIEIKHRISGAVLFAHDGPTVKDAVEAAVKARANLTGADLTRANLTRIREDFHAVLSAAPNEVGGLRAALVAGKVDGSTYSGECACLVGTIANVRGCNYEKLEGLKADSSRPAERFSLAIGKGQTPETNPAAKVALGWIDEWVEGRKERVSA